MTDAVRKTALRHKPLSAALAAAFATLAVSSAPTFAQTLMQEVVVSGSRVEQDIDEVPATITTISAEDIERNAPTDLEDLMRYEVGVSVRAQPNRASGVFSAVGRAGNEGVNVRGLEGDQVRLQVDGVSLPATYASGPFAAGRGDTIDVEGYKRVEILRGASSTQYGSDGLSGAVSFLTKDPVDLLTLGQPTQSGIKVGYASADRSWHLAPSFAFRTDVVQGMALASLRRGHETENMGTNDVANVNRTTPNPAETESDYLLAKLLITPNSTHQFKLTAESLDRRNDTDVLSFFGDPFAAATLTDVDVRENIDRDLLKLDYRYTQPKASWFQVATASIYSQRSQNHQFGYEARSTNPRVRTRDTEYAEDTIGGSMQFESYFGESVAHRLVYGVDIAHSEVTSLKEGYNSSGAPFVPNKSFPDTDYRVIGAFVQDEVSLGSVSVIPGLRYDSFKLTPKVDELYTVTNATAPSALRDSEVSPRLGTIWKLAPMANIFAQYAHGFRAPKPSQVNGGVTNLTATNPYTSIGNPNLKPETSKSFELGLRGRSDALHYSLSVFRGKYKDFIASNVLVVENPAPTPDVFQSVNLSRVTISGFEARGEWAFRQGWSISAAYAHARGDSRSDGTETPLVTIDPDKLVLGLRYEQPGRFGTAATLTAVDRKERNPNPANVTTPGYAKLDLAGWYAFSKRTRLNLSINNLFDKKYVEWADVRELAATTMVLDAYTQPGRNFTVALSHQF